MAFNFEWIDKKVYGTRNYSGESFLSISYGKNSPRFYISTMAMKEVEEHNENITNILIGFDKFNKAMAIKFIKEETKGFKLYSRKKQKSASFSSKQLLKTLKEVVDYDLDSGKFKAKYNKDMNSLIVDLSKELEEK